MRNLKTIENKVKTILKKNEDARNDDMVLYLALCNLCLLYTSPSPRDMRRSRMPSSA